MRRFARFATAAGCLAVVLGLGKVHALTHGYDLTDSSRFAWSLGFVVALVVVAYGFGLPDIPREFRRATVAALGAMVTAGLTVSFAQLVVGSALLPRAVVLGSAVVLVPWLVFCARMANDARTRAEGRDRIVLVGDHDEAATLRAELERAPERNAIVVAVVAPDAVELNDPPSRPLVDLVHGERATVLVLSREAQGYDDVVQQAALLHESGVRIRTLSLFYEHWLGKLPVNELERVSLLFDVGELHAPHYARMKRLFDLVCGAIGVLAMVALLPVVVIGNLVGNRGPLFFRQLRIGRDGRSFEILKFRTMVGRDGSGRPTEEDDPRITRFGGLLRRSHLDEMPQAVNILRGELSVVGPRPEQVHLVDEWSGKLPFYRLRHLVRPGLTGWAQVKYRYAGTDVEALEKLQYEFFYLRYQSLRFDLRILGRTIRSVVGRDGR